MSVGDVYRVAQITRHPSSGQEVVNVFHYHQDNEGTGIETGAQKIARGWINELGNLYAACISSSYTCDRIEVRLVDGPEGHDQTWTTPGGQSGDTLPPQTAPVISWRTSLFGRRYRGRTYLPPTVEGAQAGGVLTSTFVATITAFANAAIIVTDAATGTTFSLMIRSEVGNVNTAVTYFLVRPQLYTQRRRVLGVGS